MDIKIIGDMTTDKTDQKRQSIDRLISIMGHNKRSFYKETNKEVAQVLIKFLMIPSIDPINIHFLKCIEQ